MKRCAGGGRARLLLLPEDLFKPEERSGGDGGDEGQVGLAVEPRRLPDETVGLLRLRFRREFPQGFSGVGG